MKIGKVTLITITTLIITACHSHKKNSTSTVSATPAPATISSTITAPPPSPFLMTRSPEGLNAPGNEELTAIQVQYADVTIDILKEGHIIYTQGACIKCHEAKSIYKRQQSRWKDIIEDMAKRTKITDEQKDAVYKYVLAMKATQPK